jgi:hypothetical protein
MEGKNGNTTTTATNYTTHYIAITTIQVVKTNYTVSEGKKAITTTTIDTRHTYRHHDYTGEKECANSKAQKEGRGER